MSTLGKILTLLLAASFLTSFVVFNPFIVKAQPKTIIVPDDYPTIQKAVINASAGDIIFVKEGTYYAGGYSPIKISKSLSLIGQDKEATIIEGIEYRYISSAAIMDIESASGIDISGFTIDGGPRRDSGI